MRSPTQSERCSLMVRPGEPPRRERPADCEPGAAYVRMAETNGGITMTGGDKAAFPVVIEGGSGNDQVRILGTPPARMRIDGGPGDDRITIEPAWRAVADTLGPQGMLLAAAVLLALGIAAALVAIARHGVRRAAPDIARRHRR